jgi:hypothetical protein
MAAELNLDDYTGDFMGKIGNVEDFSREVLVGVAHVFADTINYLYHAQTTVFAPKVGLHKAWDVAGEMSRGLMRQVMPMGRFIAPIEWDWRNAQYQAIPFDCQADDLSKEGLLRLIKTYWDQYLKAQNLWLDKWFALIGEETWELQSELYKLIIDYEYPKLAKVLGIEPKYVVDYLKLACLSIDGTIGYGGKYEVIDRNHVVLKMRKCEVMERYREEGLYPADRGWKNCTFEQRISEPFFPGCKLHIKLPPADLNIPEGEPYCVWTFTKD